jgi:NADH dehydrogenase
MIRVILVHPGDFVLPELGEELGRYASRKLAERAVEIRPNTRVKAVTSREVELTDGTRIDSFTLVWTAGTSPHPLLNQLDLPKKTSASRLTLKWALRLIRAFGRSVTVP